MRSLLPALPQVVPAFGVSWRPFAQSVQRVALAGWPAGRVAMRRADRVVEDQPTAERAGTALGSASPVGGGVLGDGERTLTEDEGRRPQYEAHRHAQPAATFTPR